jgi:hypothetical protein
VWCALDEAGAYDDCNGAMRFDDMGLTKHVDGEVSEPDEGEYVMDVSSSDASVDCTLTNTPRLHRDERTWFKWTAAPPRVRHRPRARWSSRPNRGGKSWHGLISSLGRTDGPREGLSQGGRCGSTPIS